MIAQPAGMRWGRVGTVTIHAVPQREGAAMTLCGSMVLFTDLFDQEQIASDRLCLRCLRSLRKHGHLPTPVAVLDTVSIPQPTLPDSLPQTPVACYMQGYQDGCRVMLDMLRVVIGGSV